MSQLHARKTQPGDGSHGYQSPASHHLDQLNTSSKRGAIASMMEGAGTLPTRASSYISARSAGDLTRLLVAHATVKAGPGPGPPSSAVLQEAMGGASEERRSRIGERNSTDTCLLPCLFIQ